VSWLVGMCITYIRMLKTPLVLLWIMGMKFICRRVLSSAALKLKITRRDGA
jgi:hypothetical protein